MHDFDYEAPETLAGAISLLSEHHKRARPLAGGTDLIDHVRTGRLTPDLLVDVKRVPELNQLAVTADGLTVGAAVPCSRIYESDQIVNDYAALVDSTRIIGGIQIQNRATLGGNLCNSGPAADSTPAMIALDGRCLVAGPGGTREVPVHEFCTAPGANILNRGELLVAVRFPAPSPRGGSHYRRFIPRNEMDIAVVGVGAAVELNDTGDRFATVRLGLGAVAPTPLLVDAISADLPGMTIDDGIAAAVDLSRGLARPIDDHRGTVQFRLHVTGVLTDRVLRAAVDRARQRMAG